MEALRVMVFYGGAFFKQGQIYSRHHEERGWFDLQRLHSLLEQYVADKARRPREIRKVVAAHCYDGRLTTNVADAKQLEKERDFEMALIKAGIIPHYLTVSETAKVNLATSWRKRVWTLNLPSLS